MSGGVCARRPGAALVPPPKNNVSPHVLEDEEGAKSPTEEGAVVSESFRTSSFSSLTPRARFEEEDEAEAEDWPNSGAKLT